MRRSERLILTAILLLGAVLRLWGLPFGVPHSGTPFFRSPLLEFSIVSAIHRIGWEIGVLALSAGVATIGLVYWLVERLFDRLTAITAAFFVAIAFLHVRDSHFGASDVPMTALVVAALVALAAAVDDPTRLRRWLLSGALSGLAASTNYNGGLVLAACLATAVVTLIQSEASKRPDVLRGTATLLVAALMAFLCATPYAMLDSRHFFEALQFDFNQLMDDHGIVLGRGWVHHLTFSLWYGLGAPLFVAGLGGMALLAATSWKKAGVILTFPILYYVTVGRGYSVLVHYITPVVPFLCITAAYLLVRIVQRFVKAESVPRFVALIGVVLALPSIARVLAFDVLIGRTDTRVLAQEWVAAHVPASDVIGQIPPVLIYPGFGMAEPANLATFDINRKAFVSAAGATVSPDWIMVPTSPLTAYTVSPDELATLADRDYVRDASITATHGPEMSGWFDQQDLFFMPFTTFTMRDRPGPEIQIFRRRR